MIGVVCLDVQAWYYWTSLAWSYEVFEISQMEISALQNSHQTVDTHTLLRSF